MPGEAHGHHPFATKEGVIKTIFVTLALMLCVASTSFAAAPGDLNADGQVSIMEVQQVINSYLGLYVQPPAAVLTDIKILSVEPFETFRTSTTVTFGVRLTASNTGGSRANLTIVYAAKAPDDATIFERSINWAVDSDPIKTFQVQITSFTLPAAQYDTARWTITSISLN